MTGADYPEPQEGFDDQDRAETLDETMTDDEMQFSERRTFEELPELMDVTRADGDRDEDEALALDADEFTDSLLDEVDIEEDDELDYHAADAEREDDIDGLGDEDSFDEDALSAGQIEGLDEVADADLVEGGEDDVTDFQSKGLADDDLEDLGYSDIENGEARAKD
ncbi:primosomal protein [Phenylobacterium immobile]|uniref:primosomal protein n=1 Tax=Phenylobacterium immobile TaxID=21 RepID=UPI000A6BCDC2|nr:primosomal protein [Phenylobacterium immobile]